MTRTMDKENFPVGSWLVAAPLRPLVHAFYRFARAADDISDASDLTPEEKARLLDEMDAQLQGAPGDGPAVVIHDRLKATDVPIVHCRELLVAFKRDSVKPRTKDWADLLDYCRYSASPVGRFLLDLHKEDHESWPANDALCTALQILNHLQDCRDDFLALGRVYLPADWLAEEGTNAEELAHPGASPAIRRVLDRVIEATRPLIRHAGEFPAQIRSSGLRREAAVIVAIAERLIELLARRDPLAERVELGKAGFLMAGLTGLGRTIF